MAKFTINIPDADLPRVINALCADGGYQDTIGQSPNPQTKAQFAKEYLVTIFKSAVRRGDSEALIKAHRKAVEDAGAELDTIQFTAS